MTRRVRVNVVVLCFVSLLCVVSSASADDYFWWQEQTGDWNDASAWGGTIPVWDGDYTGATLDYVIVRSGTLNVTDNQGSGRLLTGYDGLTDPQPPTVNVSPGADLHIGLELMSGQAGGDGVLNNNGTMYCEQLQWGQDGGGAMTIGNGGHLQVGFWGCFVGMAGAGTIDMDGTGSMTVWGDTGIAMSPLGHIDIEDGVLAVLGDFTTQLAGYIAATQITGYDGSGIVNAPSYDGEYTTVTAIPEPATMVLLGLGGLLLRRRIR